MKIPTVFLRAQFLRAQKGKPLPMDTIKPGPTGRIIKRSDGTCYQVWSDGSLRKIEVTWAK